MKSIHPNWKLINLTIQTKRKQIEKKQVQKKKPNKSNKSVFCTRAYKDFPKLFDVLYIAISVDRGDQALLSHFTIAGVTQDSALNFTEKFMESISWK